MIAVTDGAGATVGINTYDEHGIPAAANMGRFQYTGQAWLPEIGLYYYKARMYSATLGRFMQTDPIGYDDGINMYAYVGGDPVNGTDPSGMAKAMSPVPPSSLAKDNYDWVSVGDPCRVKDCSAGDRFGVLSRGGPVSFSGERLERLEPGAAAQKPQPADKKKSNCDLVADQPGEVFVDFGSASLVAGIGLSGAVGVFKNLSTGSGGFFYTAGGNLGLEATAGLSGGFYRSAADLRGFTANINVSAGVSGSANFSASGRLVGATAGTGGKLGGSVSASNTTFFGCNYNGG